MTRSAMDREQYASGTCDCLREQLSQLLVVVVCGRIEPDAVTDIISAAQIKRLSPEEVLLVELEPTKKAVIRF